MTPYWKKSEMFLSIMTEQFSKICICAQTFLEEIGLECNSRYQKVKDVFSRLPLLSPIAVVLTSAREP